MAANFNSLGTLPWPTSGGGPAGTGTGYVRKAVSGASNAAPIVIQCTAHGMNTGDTVELEGIGGNSGANGLFQITKVDANDFSLNGSSGTGAYTSGGYAIDYELQPAVYIEQPGNAASMVTLAPVLEASINPQAFLYRRLGKYRFYNDYALYIPTISTPYSSNPWSTNNNFTSTTNVALASSTYTFASMSQTTGISPVFAAGDLLQFTVSFTVDIVTHTGTQNSFFSFGLGLIQASSIDLVFGEQMVMGTYLAGGHWITPVTITGFVYISNAGVTLPASNLSACVTARLDFISSANQVDILGIGSLNAYFAQYRPN